MIKIGQVNTLVVERETSSGYYLKDLESQDEVFLPPALADGNIEVGSEIEVFIYHDTSDSLLATTEIPYAEVGEYALMTAIETREFGAFFDWGIAKDLLVPGNQQKIKVREDEDHIVRVCLEEETGRVFGSTKLGKYIQASEFDIKAGDQVNITVAHKTDLGYRVIVNKKFIGMIYDNEIFQNIYPGDQTTATVKKLREDGLVDLSLRSLGLKNLTEAQEIILNALKQNQGKLNLSDKSLPESIKSELNMSKKSFKSAIGMLYKQRFIIIHKDFIELVNKDLL